MLPASRRIAVTAVALLLAVLTACSDNEADPLVKIQPTKPAGVTSLAGLKNAPIPASCDHDATTLVGYSKDFGAEGVAGSATLLTKTVRFGDITGDGVTDGVVVLECTNGGAGVAEQILIYGEGPKLEGFYDFRTLPTGQEHDEVDSLTIRGGDVDVAFHGYDGDCCFAASTYEARLTYSDGKVELKNDTPLTIDFTEGQPAFGVEWHGRIVNPDDAETWMRPAPADLTNS